MLNSNINIDLHIHSIASQYKDGAGIVKNSTIDNIDVLLDALLENDIRLFSITDHNRFDIDLYKALEARIADRNDALTLLPGIKFDVQLEDNKPACHIITIFGVPSLNETTLINSVLSKNEITVGNEFYSMNDFGNILFNIGFPVILIAHQHSGLSINQRKRSLSASTDNAIPYYKFGYIDALEYNRPNVQAILKNELRDLHLPAKTLLGSDCHDWSCYPKHDPKSQSRIGFPAKIRALPTFRGLLMALTSPETRIGVPDLEEKETYLKSIELCGKLIPMSPGLNALIGENGIGKSTVLNHLVSTNDRHMKWEQTTASYLGLIVEQPVLPQHATIIRQGQLQKDFSSGLFDSSFFRDVNNEQFETSVKNFSNMLKESLDQQINTTNNRHKAEQMNFFVDEEKEGNTYYIDVKCDDTKINMANPYNDTIDALNSIITKLEIELRRKGIYTDYEHNALNDAYNIIIRVKTNIDKRRNIFHNEQDIRSIIKYQFNNYKIDTGRRSNNEDLKKQQYRDKKNEFIDTIKTLAIDSIRKIEFPDGFHLSEEAGISVEKKNGFEFIRKAAYAGSVDLLQEFVEMFNKSYKNYESICNIKSFEEINSAIPGKVDNDWHDEWDSLVNKFIEQQEKTEETIRDSNMKKGIGNTLGERSLAYYKYQTSNADSDIVFIIDQPEDNISNKRVYAELRDYFNDLRYRCQVIMVTHNPLLVVNQDVDNVIILDEENGKPNVHSGCLEYCDDDGTSLLGMVADLMDGGEEAISRRLKAYGTNN